MSLRMRLGYWTIYQGETPLASFADFAAAWSAIWDVSQEAQHA